MTPTRTVTCGPGLDEVYDVWEPSAASPAGPFGAQAPGGPATLVLVHGGLWHAAYDRHQLDPLAAAAARAGWHAVNVEYLRLGMPGGGWPGTARSALAGLQAVVDDPALPGPRVVVGHSAGGHLVVWCASAGRLRGATGVVSVAGILDLSAATTGLLGSTLTAFLGGDAQQAAAAWAHADPALARLSTPTVLVHGTADELVPDEQARRYLATRGPSDASCRLELLAGVEHFGVMDPRRPECVAVLAAARRLAFPGAP